MLITLVILFGLGFLSVGCVALVGNEVADDIRSSTGTASPDDYEVSQPQCTVAGGGFGPRADGTLTNTSDERQGFLVQVVFEAPDGTVVGRGSTFTGAVDVGASTPWRVVTSIAHHGNVVCRVSGVSYTISSGLEPLGPGN